MCKDQQRWAFEAHSPQICYRQHLVKFITEVCDRMNFSVLTLHLSVHFVDHIMEKYDVHTGQLEQLALGCILIAGKHFIISTVLCHFVNIDLLH